MGVSENRDTHFGGVPLTGFYSIWGITGAPLFLENTHKALEDSLVAKCPGSIGMGL